MNKLFHKIRQFQERRAYKQAQKLAETVSEEELNKSKLTGSMSAEMAMKLIRGDKKAIKRYRMLQKDKIEHIT